MQGAGVNGTAKPGAASVPEGLVSAVVHLVETGPVYLGALVIRIDYTTEASTETAGATTDLVLVTSDDRLYSFGRDPGDQQRLGAQPLHDNSVRDTVADLVAA
jgi:hypothetical protein